MADLAFVTCFILDAAVIGFLGVTLSFSVDVEVDGLAVVGLDTPGFEFSCSIMVFNPFISS